MPRQSIPNPLQIARLALDRTEAGINTLADRRILHTQGFARALNQYTKLSLGVQHVAAKTLATLFERLDIPSRSEFNTLAAAVQRIEDKLDQLLPAKPSQARPPRTRQPAPDPLPQPAPAKKAARSATSRRGRKS